MRLGRIGLQFRWISLLLPLLLPVGLRAEGESWIEFLTNWRKADHAPVTLLVPKDRLPAVYPRSDEALLLLGATGDMNIQAIDGPGLVGLQEARGWKEGPHWILLGRDGAVLDEGTDLPTGDYLQSRLSGAGIPSTWELLNTFIREHPDNGSAIQRRLIIATRLARRRLLNLKDQGKVHGVKFTTESLLPGFESAKLVDQALPEEWCLEVEDSLNRLNQLPDPWRLGNRLFFQLWLDLYGKVASPGLRVELAKLKDAVQKAWGRCPHSRRNPMQAGPQGDDLFGLGEFWMACEVASSSRASLPELPMLIPSPGRFWPDSLVLSYIWSRPGWGHGQEFLTFLDRLPSLDSGPIPWSAYWREWTLSQAISSKLRALSLANLGRWQDAVSALQECRRISGKDWKEIGPPLLEWLSTPPSADEPDKATTPKKPLVPDTFLEVLRLPPLEDLRPPPKPEPLRFLVWGQPGWISQWEALRGSPSLAPWSVAELTREVPSESDTARMVQAGFPTQGWAVFHGHATIVARGEDRPNVAQLEAHLRSVAPSRIHLLDDFVAKHPEHLDARRDRLALVKARMPQASLETRFQEDAAAALLSLDFGPEAPWVSDLEGWRNQARKVVPELEAILQRWPDNAEVWRAWITWNAFQEKPESVMAFTMGLPVFGPRRAWLTNLPVSVHRAVSAEGRRTRRFGLVIDWFEGAWAQVSARSRGSLKPQAGDLEKAVYEGYREALALVGRKAECPDLDREWAALQSKAKAAQETD